MVYKPEQFLERLAKDRTLVSCQLLAREVDSSVPVEFSNKAGKRAISEVLPELSRNSQGRDEFETDEPRQEVAICRVTYRPTFLQLFPSDVATQLIAAGNASVASSILGREATSAEGQTTTSTIKDSSQRLQDLRNDVKYLDRLTKTELEAARQSMGMWSLHEVRESKREVVEEIEFQAKANFLRKLWRWVRGD